MGNKFNKEIQLLCDTCGGYDFEFNEEKTYIKCRLCNREYLGGYEELVEFNKELIDMELGDSKKELIKDVEKELHNSLKKAFKNNKFFKLK